MNPDTLHTITEKLETELKDVQTPYMPSLSLC